MGLRFTLSKRAVSFVIAGGIFIPVPATRAPFRGHPEFSQPIRRAGTPLAKNS